MTFWCFWTELHLWLLPLWSSGLSACEGRTDSSPSGLLGLSACEGQTDSSPWGPLGLSACEGQTDPAEFDRTSLKRTHFCKTSLNWWCSLCQLRPKIMELKWTQSWVTSLNFSLHVEKSLNSVFMSERAITLSSCRSCISIPHKIRME